MDIQKLTENYRKRFDAFYGQDAAEDSGRKKKKTPPERPNFLAEVIRPVLDALVELMPEYGFPRPRTSTPCTGTTIASRPVSSS